MGISTIQSYCGAQIFEAIGLGNELIKKYFRVTKEYIIHYFSYPYEDLELPNKQIINFCLNNRKKEYFCFFVVPNRVRL